MKFFLPLIAAAVAAAVTIDEAIDRVWLDGFVADNIGRSPFLIHRPRSETPGDAVSEGVGYGLILAMYCNDQIHFDALLEGADATMWNGAYYDWRVNTDNQRVAYGGATDAEQDIAAMLIMAHRREDWIDGYGYADRALLILDHLWTNGIQDGILRPGYDWGGYDLVNPGYFAPAWYRMFHEFDTRRRDWMSVVDRSYDILERSPGYDKGLVPDWMTAYGGEARNLGYNAYGDGRYMYKDAIRALWRIGTDLEWNGDERARQYIENARRFLTDAGGMSAANFYQMDGELVPDGDVWVFDGGSETRPRREHSPLTVGMWAFAAENKTEARTMLMSFYESGPYWRSDAAPNEMYFEQFLGEFGALYLSGRWRPL